MLLLILSADFHHKNRAGLEAMLRYLGIDFTYGGVHDIAQCDVVYSPFGPVDVRAYPDKRFVFGPHFSVFPDAKVAALDGVGANAVYIQPSSLVVEVWRARNLRLRIAAQPFPVDTDRFCEVKPRHDRTRVVVYFKHRHPDNLARVLTFLRAQGVVDLQTFDYGDRYDEGEYLRSLQESRYGVWVDGHESQGFALQEALACNVPLLVWDASMRQAYGFDFDYTDVPATSIPYWDARCGEWFYEADELAGAFARFIAKLDAYCPRAYVLERLGVAACAAQFRDLLASMGRPAQKVR